MTQGIFVLQTLVEKIRNSYHGANTAHSILVDSEHYTEEKPYELAMAMMNNSAIYITAAQAYYDQNEIVHGFSEITACFDAFFDLQNELFEVLEVKERNLSWFQSRYDRFSNAIGDIEQLMKRENDNFQVLQEEKRTNSKAYKENAHKFISKGK